MKLCTLTEDTIIVNTKKKNNLRINYVITTIIKIVKKLKN